MKRKKLNILHVGNHTFPCMGGIENVIWQSAQEQARRGNEVSILVFNTCSQGKEKLPAEEVVEKVKILRVSPHGWAFYRIPPVKRLLEEARGKDIVHVHGFGAWLDLLCLHQKKFQAKIVLTTHGGFHHTKERKWLKGIYSVLVLPRILEKVDFVMGVSPSDKQFFPRIHSHKSEIIPNGVEVEPLVSFSFSKKKDNHFLFVGRLSQNKRIDQLIDVFSLLAKKIPECKLVIAGEDWENLGDSLEKREQMFGVEKNIVFAGKVSPSELHQLYKESLFVISASAYEGFGISIIEGMAAGCVPILSDIPSFREFAGEGRGLILNFSQPEKAVTELEKFLCQPKIELKKREEMSRKFARKFSVETITRKQLDIYEKLVND